MQEQAADAVSLDGLTKEQCLAVGFVLASTLLMPPPAAPWEAPQWSRLQKEAAQILEKFLSWLE